MPSGAMTGGTRTTNEGQDASHASPKADGRAGLLAAVSTDPLSTYRSWTLRLVIARGDAFAS